MVVASLVIVLVGVLGVAAAVKARDLGAFAAEVADYRLVPARLVTPVARGVVAAEVVAAVLLALPGARAVGGWLAAGLFALFLGAAASVLAGGRTVRCGCFGGGRGELSTVGPPTVVRTAALGVLAVAVALGPPAEFTPLVVPLAALVAVLVFLLSELTRLATLGPASTGVVRP
jgi:putative oxidoreductase